MVNTALQPTVYVVEDNQAVRESLAWMFAREGLRVEAYAKPRDLLAEYDPTRLGCLVLDFDLPEMNGLELRKRLVELGGRHPFIVIAGYGEVRDATKAMRMGALDFMEKPLDRDAILESVRKAIDGHARWQREQAERDGVQARIDALSPRELEVLDFVIAGLLTKQIARQLGVGAKTIEAHRSNITKKMQTGSVAELVRLVTVHRSSHAASGEFGDRSGSSGSVN